MNDPWNFDSSAPQTRRPLRKSLGLALIACGVVVGIHHFDPIGRAAYAFQSGRLKAEKESLADIAAKDVADLERISKAFHLIAETVKPSVVGIETTNVDNTSSDDSPRRRFRSRISSSAGSGVVFDEKGHILTSNHVVTGAERINVTLADGRVKKATMVGSDKMTDVAVLKIDADHLHAAQFGDSDALEVGYLVFAIGSPFRLSQSVSHGIVSAKGRDNVGLNIDYQDFIQTDVPTNPGNSGGPLVNIRGQVVGINTAIATDSGQFAGVAFSMPSNLVRKIANRLISGGKVVRGYLGVEILTLTTDAAEQLGLKTASGVMIASVREDEPAAKGGIKDGDVVLTINNQPIQSMGQLQQFIADVEPGHEAVFKVWRDRKEKELHVKVGEQPVGLSLRGGVRPAPDTDNARPDAAARFFMPALGMGVETLSPDLIARYELRAAQTDTGAVVTRIAADGPAFAAGLRSGDIIVAVDGERVRSRRDFREAITDQKLKDGAKLRVIGVSGKSRDVDLKGAEG